MKNLNKVTVTFKKGTEKKVMEFYEEYSTLIPENTLNVVSENVLEFLPGPEDEVFQKYDVIDFLNSLDLYEDYDFDITDEEVICYEKGTPKSTGRMWSPISGGNNEDPSMYNGL